MQKSANSWQQGILLCSGSTEGTRCCHCTIPVILLSALDSPPYCELSVLAVYF